LTSLNLKQIKAKIVPKTAVLVAVFSAFLGGCSDTRNLPRCDAYFKPGSLEKYVIESDSVVRDTRSGLRWYRCAAGQTIQSGLCVGDPLRVSWDDAEGYAKEFSKASGKTWRMPTYDEMKDASEPECRNPAYNPNAFPNLPIENFWTGTEQIGTIGQACQIFSFTGHGHCRAFKRDGYLMMLVQDPTD